MRVPVSINDPAVKGHTYIGVLKTDFPIFNEELTEFLKWCMNIFAGISGELLSYSEGKNITITNVELVKTDRIEVTFFVNDNPVQIGVIILAILGVLGLFAGWLIIDGVDEVIEDSPILGVGIGSVLIAGALIFGTKFLKG